MEIEKLFEEDIFLNQTKKEELLTPYFNQLTQYHYNNCEEYKKILDIFGFENKQYPLTQLPFLSIRLFKELQLKSTNEILKTMTSSGTSGSLSKIFLDKTTALNQTKVLAKIVTDFIGQKRLPMIVLDTPSVLKDRRTFSARGSGILGFSLFAKKRIFAYDDNMNLELKKIEEFLEKYPNEPILLFGFTFMVWEFFYKALKKMGKKLNLDKAILFHGGGWKKLIKESVTNEEFKNSLFDVANIEKIHNYYGMVEQTGSIFVECEYGHLHSSIYSDIIVRDKEFNSIYQQEGIIQLLSTIPLSYPGHNILTEDLGEILGIDDCPCGRGGKYFKINGRIKKAQLRGCSDTFR